MVMVDESAQLDEALAALLPELDERAAEGDRLRTMPVDLVNRLKEAGLFRLALPRSLGGLELEPLRIIEIIEALSKADGSAGWTVMIGNSTAFFAWLDPAVAESMIGGNPDFSSTSMFGPLGTAAPDGPDHVIVNGRWPFNSGCPHSEWLQLGVFTLDDEGRPSDWQFAYLRRDQVNVLDTWDAGGLRGTGSHDVEVTDVRIPRSQLCRPPLDPARHDGPLWRLPFFRIAGMFLTGLPLGIARRALDEILALAPTKARGLSQVKVAEDVSAQHQLGAAEASLQAARAFVVDAWTDAWATVCGGDRLSMEQQGRLLLAGQHAMKTSLDVVTTSYRLAGAGAVYESSALQRCFRDINAAGQHAYFSDDSFGRWARVRLEVGEPPVLF